MHNLETWKFILANLEMKVPTMLLYVLDSKGSSPGRKDFFMAVNASQELSGSIGGGIMEHKWVEFAKERLRDPQAPINDVSIRRQVHDKSAGTDQSGMICSGEQTLLIYPVKETDVPEIKKLVNALGNHTPGELFLSTSGIRFDGEASNDGPLTVKEEDPSIYQVRSSVHYNHVSIIGGGHCSLALSKLLYELGFYIRVYDDRPGLSTMNLNSYAHEKHLLKNYAELPEKISQLKDHFVVVMTFGYRTDDEVIRALTGIPFRYLGLLGSKKKINTMMDQYRKEGYDEKWLNSIRAPIGIPINSHTPAEIAVSIAAEIIKIKNAAYE